MSFLVKHLSLLELQQSKSPPPSPIAMSNAILTDLSPEILHNLFFFVNATDLACLAATCRFLHDFIQRDDLLWRRIYLSLFVRSVSHRRISSLCDLLKFKSAVNSHRITLDIRLNHGLLLCKTLCKQKSFCKVRTMILR